MQPSAAQTFSAVVAEERVPDAGFYTWDIPDNVLYADSALAELFGLEAADAEKGLPLEVYLERVHHEDRPRLAKTIRDSIVGHHPQQETYRVLNGFGQYVPVVSYGRGFRDQSNNPVRYVGIVIPSGEESPISMAH